MSAATSPACALCRRPAGAAVTEAWIGPSGPSVVHTECLQRRADEQRQRDCDAEAAELSQSFRGQSERLPVWPYARLNNAQFRKRVSPTLWSAIESWHPRMGSLVLSAPSGAGKTSLAVAWLWRLHDRTVAAARGGERAALPTFAFLTGPELSGARRRSPMGAEAPLLDRAMRARLLVLDELGFEPLCEELLALCDARYARRVPTIVTTGLRLAELQRRYGEAVYRRLTEAGAAVEAWGT